ncbi:hypothetical protein P389DRAFT_210962, partial [Cystobasidium minutum MCA 4210]|uniref:uncharacterized protein n=1 Tax=Cystobasidium minutum MCA 4210 TaxID=1397322 RepID=UPI0034CD75AF|eukprot:jgi/Rhomi1/210962/estExt_Genemark1.C_4_t20059
MATPPHRVSKRKLAKPIQAPRDLGYQDPAQEAAARKTRYLSVSLGDLASSGAPTQIWTTEHPQASKPRVEEESDTTLSFSSSISEASSSSSSSKLTVDLSKYLARIPTVNDRAFRGKLNRVESILVDNTYLAEKEPDTPSSLMPRNTLPKVLSPGYVPPGRRGSRAPAVISDPRQHEEPIVQATSLKRTSSSSSVYVARRSAPHRRTSSSDKAADDIESSFPVDVVAPADTVLANLKRGRGRPRKAVLSSGASLPAPAALRPTWTTRAIVETPLQSPSVSSNSTLSPAEDSTLEDEDDSDDDEDGSYAPPVPHRKKITITKVSPPSSASQQPAVGPPRMCRQPSNQGDDKSRSRIYNDAGRENAPYQHASPTMQQSGSTSGPRVGPAFGHFNEKKRNFSDMSTSNHDVS